MKHPYPAFGICGYSGSGKTTVILKLIEDLVQRGLKVGIAKHDVHGLNIDKEGKDTDRFFKAGADVIIRGPEQSFLRTHRRGDMDLTDLLTVMGPYFDLILVEGHKSTPLPQKVWLSGEDGDPPPDGIVGIQRVLKREDNRLQILTDMIDEWLPRAWKESPVYAGILLGDGAADARLESQIDELREQVDDVVLIGRDPTAGLSGIPFLNEVQDAAPPVSGMLAAGRWRPMTSWVFLPAALPSPPARTVSWLLDQRKPGTWAVLPQTGQPLAYCDFRSFHLLEETMDPASMAGMNGVTAPELPGNAAEAG